MWIFSRVGFFSVVQKEGDTFLTIRARVKRDIENLRDQYLPSLGAIHESAGTDYQFRATASHDDFAGALQKMALDINYSNFKDSVASEQGYERTRVYGAVWSALWKLAS